MYALQTNSISCVIQLLRGCCKMFNTTRLPVSPFPGIILSYEKQLTTCRWLVIFSSLSEKATPFMLLEAKLYKHVYGCTHILVDYIGSNYSRVSAASSLLLIPSAEGSGIRADWAGADLEVSRCLSAEQAIVQQLHGCTTPALFRVYSAAPVKCRRRPQSIVWRQVCLSCTRMLTSTPSEFTETVKSLWMGAVLHK